MIGAMPSDGSSRSTSRGRAARRARHRQHLLLAAAHHRRAPVEHLAQVREQRQQRLQVERAALAADAQVLAHREIRKDAPVFRHVAEAEPRPRVRRQPVDAAAVELDCALRGNQADALLSSVDLPAPLRPISATTSPAATSSCRPNSACALP